MTPSLSAYDLRYIERHIQDFDEFTDLDDMGPEFRAEVEARLGIKTHRTRTRFKSSEYDWRWINEQMTAHRMSNETMAVIFKMVYGRSISQGTVACIRSGSYTHSRTVDDLVAILDGTYEQRRRW